MNSIEVRVKNTVTIFWIDLSGSKGWTQTSEETREFLKARGFSHAQAAEAVKEAEEKGIWVQD